MNMSRDERALTTKYMQSCRTGIGSIDYLRTLAQTMFATHPQPLGDYVRDVDALYARIVRNEHPQLITILPDVQSLRTMQMNVSAVRWHAVAHYELNYIPCRC
jgi:hypothetical protein